MARPYTAVTAHHSCQSQLALAGDMGVSERQSDIRPHSCPTLLCSADPPAGGTTGQHLLQLCELCILLPPGRSCRRRRGADLKDGDLKDGDLKDGDLKDGDRHTKRQPVYVGRAGERVARKRD